MKKTLLVLIGLALTSAAHASDITLTGRGDFLRVRNNGADDTGAISFRVEKPVYRELSVAIEGQWQGRSYFPSVDDPKGAFGSLTGYGVLAEILFRPVVNDKFSPYIFYGSGGFWWDFKENPFLQDNFVRVSVEPSFAQKLGIGFDYWLNDRWAVNVEASYFATDIEKHAIDNKGTEWNVVGADGNIGHEEIQIGAGLTYRF